MAARRVIALIDGEHHPGVVRDALARLAREQEVVGAVFCGGEEKVGPGALAVAEETYGVPVEVAPDPLDALRALAGRSGAQAVVDLADEPVVAPARKLELASLSLHLGLDFLGPGLELRAPRPLELDYGGPTLAVIGTGKRTGKTAVAGRLAGLLRDALAAAGEPPPVVVSMGRGGPPEPELARAADLDTARLLELARAGRHAASDYLEDALLAGVDAIGCRRAGGGLAGEPYDSNVAAGAALAAGLEPGAILFEGSGALMPPVRCAATVCVTTARRAREEGLGALGPLRLLAADLVVVTGASHVHEHQRAALERELGRWGGAPVAFCDLCPEPAQPLPRAARCAVFTTAPPQVEPELRGHLAAAGVTPELVSFNLARRAALAADLDAARAARAGVYLTELKAAAIDTVAAAAARDGARLAFLRNRPVALPGGPDLDVELLRLVAAAGLAAEVPA